MFGQQTRIDFRRSLTSSLSKCQIKIGPRVAPEKRSPYRLARLLSRDLFKGDRDDKKHC